MSATRSPRRCTNLQSTENCFLVCKIAPNMASSAPAGAKSRLSDRETSTKLLCYAPSFSAATYWLGSVLEHVPKELMESLIMGPNASLVELLDRYPRSVPHHAPRAHGTGRINGFLDFQNFFCPCSHKKRNTENVELVLLSAFKKEIECW